ncbi:S41 family peptidase [Candidatus Woesebacteria bacterium]|nr:S41 family peptidase [Candidatus Woesebacteria bacterium]QQG47304.1 MAG: S41 family peptidase [Candidatus Woesebacteria bacterium]
MKKLPKVSIKLARNVVLGIFVVTFTFVFGYLVGLKGITFGQVGPRVSISRDVPVSNLDFSLFWRVWDTLNSSYFDKSKLNSANMVYGAIKGMVEAVGDPYTVFLTPNENKITEDDLHGNFDGVGIQIGFRGTNLAVIAPLTQSPADKAGIKAGDYIIGIKDDAKKIDMGTAGITLPEAVGAIRGQAGTKVTLAIRRDGVDKPLIFDLVRATIDVPSVDLTYVGDNKDIAQIKILKFGAETLTEWNKIVDEVKGHGTTKIIIDVRNNPGGYLQAAVDIASDFVDNNQIVVSEKKGDGTMESVKNEKTPRFTNEKIVILVNKGSASASEILAGALRDDKRIKLIGDTTFGKGTVQEPEQLDSGSGLHITIAKWLTPSGFWVNEKGLDPDVKVTEDPIGKEDLQLKAAINEVSL